MSRSRAKANTLANIVNATRQFADVETGEVLELRPIRRSQRIRGMFAMTFHDALGAVADSRNLTNLDLRVFVKLLSILDQNNYLHLQGKQLAAEIGCTDDAFYRSMKRLRAANIVYEGPRVGNCRTYRLAPSHAWNGTQESRWAAVAEERAGRFGVVQGEGNRYNDPAPDHPHA